MVKMKAFQARCKAKDGVVCCQCTRLEYEAYQLNQYKEAARILTIELMEKNSLLEKATRSCEDLAKASTNMTTELATLHDQMEQVKMDAVAEFRTSQPYYNRCGGFYGNGFNDYLKKVVALYPNQDLSQVVINDTVPLTPSGVDAAINEADGDVHLVEEEAKEPTDVEAVSQNVPDGLPLRARPPPKTNLLLMLL